MKRTLKNQKENFSEWFGELLLKAELIDNRYPVKGFDVYMPYGYEIYENIINEIEKMLKKRGFKKTLFPLVIPYSFFEREAEHIKGFFEEVFIINKAGNSELEDVLIVRPTSETAMYYMFSLWIQGYSQLPLKIYQNVCVYRYETKSTRPLLRVREIPWNEAHAAFATYEEAKMEAEEIAKEYYKIFKDILCIESLLLIRPEWDKFPGAEFTLALDTPMPTGRFLQIGTSHCLGEKFSRAFNVKYKDKDESDKYCNISCHGVSCRLLGAVIGILGDDKGLRLPSNIAPIKIVVVPIIKKGSENIVKNYCKEILEKIKDFKYVFDDRNVSPGEKFYYWEMKGVPIRFEIGLKEAENREITVFIRGSNEKLTIKFEELSREKIQELLRTNDESLKKYSEKLIAELIMKANNIDELKEIIENRKFAKINFCGCEECAEKIKELTSAEVRGWKYFEREEPDGTCIVCRKPAKYVAYVGKSY
jgi:prolyl-tRNA synthetase